MICPVCDNDDIRIVETRDDRRRRECRRCLNRWTTYEVRAEDLDRLQRLEEAVVGALGPELETSAARFSVPAPVEHQPLISAEELARARAEQRVREKQTAERERRQRLQQVYDEERKSRRGESM